MILPPASAFFACAVPVMARLSASVPDAVKIRFTDIDFEAVDATVTDIREEENGESVIVMKSKKYVDMIYSTSKANIEIIKHSYEGFDVPLESIRMVDGKTGVYVVKTNKSRFVPVNILYKNKDRVIVSEKITNGESTLKLYDELIVVGRNLYDNKVVR